MAAPIFDAHRFVERTADNAALPPLQRPGPAGWEISGSQPQAARVVRVLLVCNLFTMPYRVMRCAHAAGARVWVLGSKDAQGLAHSRYCRKFLPAQSPPDGEARSETAAEINRRAEEFDIDLVMAGDAPSTRTLIALRQTVRPRCFPMPDLGWFDRLNNKWQFTGLCRSLDILCPPTRLLADRDEVLDAIASGQQQLPAIAKPLSLEGGHGVITLTRSGWQLEAQDIDYAPVLLQDFIPGEDIGASVYCEAGQILGFIAHKLARKIYATFHADAIRDAVARIMAQAGTDGVYNFDMRRTADGRVFFLECNPRFFYKIDLSMVAGMNFTVRGLVPGAAMAASVPDGRRVRMPLATAVDLCRPWTLSLRDLAMMRHLYSDPVPMVREWLRIDWED